MTKSISRLEKLYFRLEAQNACLGWAFTQIAGKPGIVFEIGLGLGRSFDHLRRYLPGREIFAFDRQVDSIDGADIAERGVEPRVHLLEVESAARPRYQRGVGDAGSGGGSTSGRGFGRLAAEQPPLLPAVGNGVQGEHGGDDHPRWDQRQMRRSIDAFLAGRDQLSPGHRAVGQAGTEERQRALDGDDQADHEKPVGDDRDGDVGDTVTPMQTLRSDGPKIGPNSPCTCGSGKKYKKCCGRIQ